MNQRRKAAVLVTMGGILVGLVPSTGRAEVPIKAPIATGAVALDEPGRYKVNRSFDETLEYYKRFFKNEPGAVRWHNVINQAGIKAKHMASLVKKTEWEGINIYERGGEVRLYVVPRTKKAPRNKSSNSS